MTAPLPSAQLDQFARRIPLVPRSHLVYPNFATRTDEVVSCAAESTQDRPLLERINLACAAWNLSALIAADCGLPDLATELCVRQLALFQSTLPLTGDTAIAGLQPIINLVRLTARAKSPEAAHQELMSVHHALHHGGSVAVHGQPVDLTGFTTRTTLGHIRPWLHALLLDDGTRFLAAAGQWAQAAAHATQYDASPDQLRDSKQVQVLAYLHSPGGTDAAYSLLDQTTLSEPWERAVAALLRHYADHLTNRVPSCSFAALAHTMTAATEPGPPHLRMFRVRLVMASIALAPGGGEEPAQPLYDAIVDETVRAEDAYAAREILRHPAPLSSSRTRLALTAVLRNGRLGQGALPEADLMSLQQATRTAQGSLVHCLRKAGRGWPRTTNTP